MQLFINDAPPAANAVFVQEFNGPSGTNPATNTPPRVTNNDALAGAACSFFSSDGTNLSYNSSILSGSDYTVSLQPGAVIHHEMTEYLGGPLSPRLRTTPFYVVCVAFTTGVDDQYQYGAFSGIPITVT